MGENQNLPEEDTSLPGRESISGKGRNVNQKIFHYHTHQTLGKLGKTPFHYFDLFRKVWRSGHLRQHIIIPTKIKAESISCIFSLGMERYNLKLKI